jgi:hypothetical protein
MSNAKKFIANLGAIGRGPGEVEVMWDGGDMFVLLDGLRIAKRGKPGTASAAQWISIEPGYLVIDSADGSEIYIRIRVDAIH